MNTVDLRAPMLLLGWFLELHGEGSELLVPLMAPLWLGLVENDPYCARMTGGAIRRSSPRAGGSAPPGALGHHGPAHRGRPEGTRERWNPLASLHMRI